MTSLHLLLTDKPAIAPPVFVFQKDKAQKVSFSFIHVFRLKSYSIILSYTDIQSRLHFFTFCKRFGGIKSFTLNKTVNKA